MTTTIDKRAKVRFVGLAMRQAAQQARELARRNGVPLVIWKDGRVVEIPPGEILDLPDVVAAIPIH